MSRIVQCANFVAPGSGGLKTALRHLASGYAEAGHDVVQVVPGEHTRVTAQPWGRLVEIRAPRVPGTGYRVITDVWRVAAELERLAPDRLEVHDRFTLRRLGKWARRHGVPSLVVSHERLDQVLAQWLPVPAPGVADWSNRALAELFDAVVCTTTWAAEEFERLGVRPALVPLGVDLDQFAPLTRLRRPGVSLLTCTRLSKEKHPGLAVETLRELVARGVPAVLTVAGTGPMSAELEEQAAGLPVTFLGYVGDRAELARLQAFADVVLSPGPVETFGLAALEALACGTPVVGNAASALPEVLGTGGVAAAGTPVAFADAVEQLLALPERERRLRARTRAEAFPWSATVAGFLGVHRVREGRAAA